MSDRKNRQLAALTMLDAYGQACRAYYLDDSARNLAAYHACRDAVLGMLESYYMGPAAHAAETEAV